MERTRWGSNDGRQRLVEMLGEFMELLSDIRPLSTDVGDAYLRGEDLPGANVAHLHGVVALRDDLIGLQRYLDVCGFRVPVPTVLVARGDMAELELAGRNEPRLGWTPPRPRKPPSEKDSTKSGAPGLRRRRVAHIEAGP